MRQFLYALILLSSQLTADDVLPLNRIMSKEEMAKTGINSLNAEQKRQLEQWLTNWTQQVINESDSYHTSKTIPEWVASWPAYAQPLSKEPPEVAAEERSVANQKIDKIRNEGEIIELKNGSVWIISPFDRHKTRRWTRNDVIRIENSRNVWRPYKLKNMTKLQIADAELKTPASETGEKEPDEPEMFKGTIGVEAVIQRGQLVQLKDKTRWAIAPADQIIARNWKKDDRIKILKTDSYLYEYSLQNLDGGETVLANKQ